MDAAKFGDLVGVRKYIEQGENVNGVDEKFGSILFAAIDSGQINVIEELIKAGADVNYAAPGPGGFTALMITVGQGRPDILRLLIKYGADVHAGDDYAIR